MQRSKFVVMLIVLLGLGACTSSKPDGFGTSDSRLRFETTKFKDSAQLAEVNGLKFSSTQILDQSSVIKDLDREKNEALIAMTYLKAIEKAGAGAKGSVSIALPESKKSLEELLIPFHSQPKAGVGLSFKEAQAEGALGKLGKTEIKLSELDQSSDVLKSIERRRYNEVLHQLQIQIPPLVLEDEAAKSKMTVENFIEARVINKRGQEVGHDEVVADLKKKGIDAASLTPEQREQAFKDVAQQKRDRAVEAYVVDHVIKGPVLVSFPAQ